MVTVFPPASSHFAVAGGLGRLDLSCRARKGLAARARKTMNELQTIAILRMRLSYRLAQSRVWLPLEPRPGACHLGSTPDSIRFRPAIDGRAGHAAFTTCHDTN